MVVKTACAFERMKDAATAANVHLKIASGFRTLARQQYFWNCYQTKKCNNGNIAARPGKSNHGLGIALDLNTKSPGVYEWLKKEASSFGFVRTVKSEPWHWEYRKGAKCSAFVNYRCTDTHLPDTSCTAQKGKCMAPSKCKGKTLQGKVCNGWFCCPGQTFCCIQGGSANPAPPPPRRKTPTPPPRSTGGAAPGAAGCSYAKQPSELITGNNNRKFPCVKIKSSDLVNPSYARYAPDKKDNTMVVKTACAFERMKDAATAANVHLKIASGFRTLARQQYFWNCYQTKKCNNGNIAARPGKSNHGLGIALDLNTKSPGVYEWLKKEASSFGFVRTVKSEPWHWEYRKGAKCSAFVNYRCTDTHLPDTSCTAQKGKCMAPSKCKGKTLQGKVCNGWFCCPGKTLCCIGGSSVKAQAAGGKKNAMKQVTQPLFIGKKVVPKAPKTQQMPKGSKCPGQGCKGPIKARPMGAGTGKKPAVTKKGTSKARKEISQAKVVAASAERAAQRAAKTTRKQGQRTRDNARTTARKTRATARTAGRRERKVVRRAGRRAMKAVRKSWKKNKHTVRHQGRRARGIARRRSRAIKKQDRRLARGHRHATRRDTRRVKGNIKAGRRSARRNARRIGRRIRKIRLKMRHRRERNQLRRGKRRFQLATRRITKLMRRQSENNRLRRVRRKERKNQKKLRVSLRTKQANREQRRFFKQLRHLERRDAKKNTAAAKLRSVRNQIRRVANRNHKTRERFRRMRFKQRASWRRNRQRRSMRRFRRRTNRRAHRKNVFRRTFKRIGTAVRSAVARGRRAVQRFRTKIASSMRNHAKRLVARHRAHRARIALRNAARRKRAAARLARVRKTVARGFKTARRVARRWAHRAVSRTQRARKRVRARHHAHRARHRARRLALRARTLARRTRRRVAHRMRVRARVARVRRGMTRMRKTMQRAGKAARKRAQRIRQRWRGVTRRARERPPS